MVDVCLYGVCMSCSYVKLQSVGTVDGLIDHMHIKSEALVKFSDQEIADDASPREKRLILGRGVVYLLYCDTGVCLLEKSSNLREQVYVFNDHFATRDFQSWKP